MDKNDDDNDVVILKQGNENNLNEAKAHQDPFNKSDIQFNKSSIVDTNTGTSSLTTSKEATSTILNNGSSQDNTARAQDVSNKNIKNDSKNRTPETLDNQRMSTTSPEIQKIDADLSAYQNKSLNSSSTEDQYSNSAGKNKSSATKNLESKKEEICVKKESSLTGKNDNLIKEWKEVEDGTAIVAAKKEKSKKDVLDKVSGDIVVGKKTDLSVAVSDKNGKEGSGGKSKVTKSTLKEASVPVNNKKTSSTTKETSPAIKDVKNTTKKSSISKIESKTSPMSNSKKTSASVDIEIDKEKKPRSSSSDNIKKIESSTKSKRVVRAPSEEDRRLAFEQKRNERQERIQKREEVRKQHDMRSQQHQLATAMRKLKKEGHDSGVDENTQSKDSSDRPRTKDGRTTPKKRHPRSVDPSPMKPMPRQSAQSVERRLPMNKIEVGKSASPVIKGVRSKIGSLDNATHKPRGGSVKIESNKLDFTKASSRISAKNATYTPGGGDKKIESQKLQWNATSKVGSMEKKDHRAGGGDKKILTQKLNFGDKAQSKIGSKDNIKHKAGGGTVEISTEKLNFKSKAASKVGSMDNVKHKAGGGDKKIYEDKEYLRQIQSNQTSDKNSSVISPATTGTNSPGPQEDGVATSPLKE